MIRSRRMWNFLPISSSHRAKHPAMPTSATSREKRREARPVDSAARRAATDEILQVMYWLRGENIAQEVAPNDLAKWVGLEASQIELILIQLLGAAATTSPGEVGAAAREAADAFLMIYGPRESA